MGAERTMRAPARLTAPTPARRAALVRTYLVICGAGAWLFLVLAVIAPWLVSLHDDAALWLAAGLLLSLPVLALYAVALARRAWRGPR